MDKKPKFIISINITNRCNLNCDYCIADAPYNQIFDNISLTNIKFITNMVNIYLQDFNIYVYLVGGEPTIYPNIDKLVDTLYLIKNLANINICSNGCILLSKLISNQTLITYSLTYHTDMMTNRYVYHNTFIENIKFIQSGNNYYSLRILNDSSKINNNKAKNLQEIKELNIPADRITYPAIISTEHYKTETKINNRKYNKYVYPYRVINITRAIQYNDNNKIRYVLSHICDINRINKLNSFKSLYSIKEWAKLSSMANTIVHCTNPICKCDVCEEIKEKSI